MASKKRSATLAGTPAEQPAPDSKATLANLYEIYARLDRVDAVAIQDNAVYNAWSQQHRTVRLAIMALEAKNFEDLAAEQQSQAPALARAIDALEDDLHGLQDDARVISAVGKGLSAITSLVGLFA